MSREYECTKCARKMTMDQTICPKCGSKERKITVIVDEKLAILEVDVGILNSMTIRERFLYASIALTMSSPVVGYLLDPAMGMILGFGAGALALVTGFKAVTKVKRTFQSRG